MMEKKLRVGILGATGMVGQRFISLLEDHPWFQVVTVAASARSAGKTYEEAVGDRWKMTSPMPEAVKKLVVMNVAEVEKVASTVDFVFSAVDMTKDEIRAIEEAYAKTETPVVSNNSAHRWTPDVPMVIPEINPEHFAVIPFQRKRLGTTRGFVAVKPNCSIQSYTPALTAWKEFEPYEVVATCTGTGYVKELGLPDGYSCIADFGLLIKAALEAEQRGLSYHVGNVLTSDVFYAPEKAKKEGVGYEDVGVLAAEMETAALYANAALAGAQALSILTISDSLITGESTTAEERQNSFMDMVQVALEIL